MGSGLGAGSASPSWVGSPLPPPLRARLTSPSSILQKAVPGTSCSFWGWIYCLWRSIFHQGSLNPCSTAGTRAFLAWQLSNCPSPASLGPLLGCGMQLRADDCYLAQPGWSSSPSQGEDPSRRVWLHTWPWALILLPRASPLSAR